MTFWGKIVGGVAGYVLGFAIGLKIDAFGWFEQAEVGALIGVLAGEVLDYWRDRRRERRSGGTGRWRWRRRAVVALVLLLAAMYGLAIWPLSFRLDWKATRLGDAICAASQSGALATIQRGHKFPGMYPIGPGLARAMRASGESPEAPCEYTIINGGWGPMTEHRGLPASRFLRIRWKEPHGWSLGMRLEHIVPFNLVRCAMYWRIECYVDDFLMIGYSG